MKQNKSTSKKQSRIRRATDGPEIISMQELREEERSHNITELEKSSPQVAGEQTASGSMPNPEFVTAKTTLQRAKKMGVYKDSKQSDET